MEQASSALRLPQSPMPPGSRIIEVHPDDPDVVLGPPTRQAAASSPAPRPGMGQTGQVIDVPPDAASTVDLSGQSHQDPQQDPLFAGSYVPPTARSPLSSQRNQPVTPGGATSIPGAPPPPTRDPQMSRTQQAVGAVQGGLDKVSGVTGVALPMVGSVAGAAVGGGPGGIAGGLAGEAAQQGLEALSGKPPTRSESASRLAIEGATSMFGEGITQAAKAGMKGTARAVRGTWGPPSADAAETLALTGGHALPSQVSDTSTAAMLDKLVAGGWLSKGTQEAERGAGQKMVESRLEQEVRGFLPSGTAMAPRAGAGPAPHMNEEWLGKVTQAAQKAADKKTFAPLSAEYDALKGAADDLSLNVDFAHVRTQAKAALDESLVKVAGAGTGQETLSAAAKIGEPPPARTGKLFGAEGEEILYKLSEPQGERISVEKAMSYISDLGNVAQIAKEGGDRKLQRNLLKLKDSVEDAIEGTLKDADPALYQRWRKVSGEYKVATETFRNKFMRDFAKADPSAAAQKILSDGSTQTVEQIRRTKANLGGTWKPVQAAMAERVLSDEQGQWKSGAEIAKSLAKLGDERSAAFFDQASGGMFALARKIDKLQEPLTKEGSLYLVLKQGAAAGTLAAAAGGVLGGSTAYLSGSPTAGTVVGAATVLLTPWAVAKMMYSQTGRALLLRGEVTPEALRMLRGVSQGLAHTPGAVGRALAPPSRPSPRPPTRPQ